VITDKEKIIEEYIIEEDKKLQNVYTMIEDSINRTNKMLDTEE